MPMSFVFVIELHSARDRHRPRGAEGTPAALSCRAEQFDLRGGGEIMEGSRGPFHAHATHKELRQVAPVCDRRCSLIFKIPTCRSGPTKHARNETGQTLAASDSLPLQPLRKQCH